MFRPPSKHSINANHYYIFFSSSSLPFTECFLCPKTFQGLVQVHTTVFRVLSQHTEVLPSAVVLEFLGSRGLGEVGKSMLICEHTLSTWISFTSQKFIVS